MTAKELAETLTAIADQTRALRDAGVVGRVAIGDVSFEIGVTDAMVLPGPPSTGDDGNVLDDPDLYGGHIPQRRRVAEVPSPRPTEADDE